MILSITGSGITLRNNEIKYIIKVIKSLENIVILLKGTTIRINTQEERFLNSFKPLMTAGLRLMKTVLIPVHNSAAGAAIKKNHGLGRLSDLASRTKAINNFKWRNGRYNENS